MLSVLVCGVVRAQPSPSPSPEVERIRGRVIERGTRTPVAASVFAVDEKGAPLAEAHADEGGGFALALPTSLAGKIHIVVTAADRKRLELDEKLAAREVVTVVYVIARTSYSRYESTVRAAPVREEIARVSL